jgi:hypothetical protein
MMSIVCATQAFSMRSTALARSFRTTTPTMMPFWMVQHNVNNPELFKEKVEPMVDTITSLDGKNEAYHKEDMHQHTLNFPPAANGDVKIGWCVFESKPGSKWNAETLKKYQDDDKAAWATQDVYEIKKPIGFTPYFPENA